MGEKVELKSAYVDPDDVVLDPTKVEDSVIARMPQPTGWRILCLPYRKSQKTKGGIVLTRETVDKESLATLVAYVVKKGPLCYSNEKKYGEHWCQEKQWILISRYAGARFKLEDDEVIGTIKHPDDIVSI